MVDVCHKYNYCGAGMYLKMKTTDPHREPEGNP